MEVTNQLFKEKLQGYEHLKNIRNRLWSEDGKSRVTVMVGSGFSLNAHKVHESLSSLPTWDGLKKRIVEELGLIDTAGDNVLDLSQKYVKEYGKSSLEELIITATPDDNYQPDQLHKELLQLPWKDVFTTNYDTLLERTLSDIYERKYQIIHNVMDIPHSVAPRIIKLHGGFPSNRPFIFTRDDYNSYEKKFAPFVNMVQQSIMENVFVLIGFSGDDPNFEQWTKWVYKNLGEYMPKIYMLAYDEEERKDMLKERGIIPIDFKEVYSIDENSNPYSQMFKDIFEFLNDKPSKKPEDWPFERYDDLSNIESGIKEAIALFKRNRDAYPGWLVLPDIIKNKTVKIVQLASDELIGLITKNNNTAIENYKALFEVLWLHDMFQIPIMVELHDLMKSVVDHYLKDYEKQTLPYEISSLIIRLLKEARLDFNEKEFSYYDNLLKLYSLETSQINSLMNEKIQMKLIKFDFIKAKELAESWEVHENDIEWQVKKAIIFLRLGEVDKAKNKMKEKLNTVRQLITKDNNNYRFYSLEGVILSVLMKLNSNTEKNSQERLSFLSEKHCNPLKELNLLYSRIKPYERDTGNFKESKFDPHRVAYRVKWKSILDLSIINSYSLVLLNEEFQLLSFKSTNAKKVMTTSLNNFVKIYPLYVWGAFFQIGDLKRVEEFFSRKIVYYASQNSLSQIFSIAKNAVQNDKNVTLMLEVLSRIYFALQDGEKEEVEQIAISYYNNEKFHLKTRFKAHKIFKNLFDRIYFDKQGFKKKDFIETIFELPIPGDEQSCLAEVQFDSVHFYDPSFALEKEDCFDIQVKESEIKRLVELLSLDKGNIRDSALYRITYLLETNNLKEEMAETVRQKIAGLIGDDTDVGAKLLTSYLAYLSKDTSIQKKVYEEKLKATIPRTFHKGVMSSGESLLNYLNEWKFVFPGFLNSNGEVFSLTTNAYKDWLNLFYEWWEDQKSPLLENENTFSSEINNDLILMAGFLSHHILNRIPVECLTKEDQVKLYNMYHELKENKIDIAIRLIPGLLRTNIIEAQEIILVENNLLDNSENYKSSMQASYDLIILNHRNSINVELRNIKSILFNLLRTRKEQTLSSVLNAISGILREIPTTYNLSEYSIIIQILQKNYMDLINGFYKNSSIAHQELKLFSASTKLAGELYQIDKDIDKTSLEVWKDEAFTNRLPGVRQYYYLFD